jgi:regulator of replication initiation timing
MKSLNEQLNEISTQLADMKAKLEESEIANNFDNWIPRKKLMAFLGYEDTQMAALVKSGKLKVAQIGNRKFINRDSVLKLLEESCK